MGANNNLWPQFGSEGERCAHRRPDDWTKAQAPSAAPRESIEKVRADYNAHGSDGFRGNVASFYQI